MDELLEILSELHPDIDFSTHNTLIDDRVFDSFDIIMLAAEINSRTGITIPAGEILPENFNSYASLKVLLERLEEEQG